MMGGKPVEKNNKYKNPDEVNGKFEFEFLTNVSKNTNLPHIHTLPVKCKFLTTTTTHLYNLKGL